MAVWSVFGWVLMGFTTLLWGLSSVASSLFDKTGRAQFFCQKQWCRWITAFSFVKVEVSGTEYLEKGKPYIFAANHQAVHDIMLVGGWIPTPFRWVVRKEWYKTPILGWHLSRAGSISIDRSNPRASAKSLLESAKTIKEGTSVLIFPEGTRNQDAILQKFKSGGFVLAQKSGVPIVPVTIIGAKDIIPKGEWIGTPGTVRMVLGKPIDTNLFKKNERDKLIHAVEDAIAEHLPPESLVEYYKRKEKRDQVAEEETD